MSRKSKNDNSIQNAGENKAVKSKLSLSLLLLLIAIVSVTATTAAWFSIADNVQITSMNMQITSGNSMRFDLDAHADVTDYVKTLTFDQIADRILADKTFDMREVPLEPVTTSDCVNYTFESGAVVEDTSGAYLTFTLHFKATQDMVIHLTSEDGEEGEQGTFVESPTPGLAQSMRISFTADGQNCIYDPGLGNTSTQTENTKTFGLPSAAEMVYNNTNTLFSLKADEDKAVVMHIWIEGTDELCTDDLKGADYSIALRFQGTDEDGNVFEGAKRGENEAHATGDAAKDYYTQRYDTADEAREDQNENKTWIEKVVDFFSDLFGSGKNETSSADATK